MWKFSHNIEINATPETLWQLWSDVENWKKWDNSIEWSQMKAPFQEGSKGQLKPRNGPCTSFIVSTAVKNKRFVTQSKLPLTQLIFTHEIVEKENTISITHSIVIQGALSFLFSKIIGKSLVSELPESMINLKKLAEAIN
ncbi:MAG: polyketide cyclase/dehydrase and lipid transport [bacterium]|nr:polyketide cyclase/dehydrase and lipid transport [bacterium]